MATYADFLHLFSVSLFPRHALHLMPCGILNPKAKCVIGNGCVVHLPTVLEEIKTLKSKGVDADGRLFISEILPASINQIPPLPLDFSKKRDPS